MIWSLKNTSIFVQTYTHTKCLCIHLKWGLILDTFPEKTKTDWKNYTNFAKRISNLKNWSKISQQLPCLALTSSSTIEIWKLGTHPVTTLWIHLWICELCETKYSFSLETILYLQEDLWTATLPFLWGFRTTLLNFVIKTIKLILCLEVEVARLVRLARLARLFRVG